MKPSVLVGSKLEKVLYFECNRLRHEFLFDGFHNMDFGIQLSFTDQKCISLFWSENERFELGFEPIEAPIDLEISTLDASGSWLELIGKKLIGVEVSYVNEEWMLPGRIDLIFEHSQAKTILLSDDLNLDQSFSLPLTYVEGGEIYVFEKESLPAFVLTTIELANEDSDTSEIQQRPLLSISNQKLIALLLLLLIGLAVMVRFCVDK